MVIEVLPHSPKFMDIRGLEECGLAGVAIGRSLAFEPFVPVKVASSYLAIKTPGESGCSRWLHTLYVWEGLSIFLLGPISRPPVILQALFCFGPLVSAESTDQIIGFSTESGRLDQDLLIAAAIRTEKNLV
jgi:hypothetical protein